MVSTITPQDKQDTQEQQIPSAAELQEQFDVDSSDVESSEKESFIENIKNTVRSKVDTVMGVLSPIPKAYNKVSEIGASFKNGIQKIMNFFTGHSEHISSSSNKEETGDSPSAEIEKFSSYADKSENIAKAYDTAEAAEQEHMNDLGDRFFMLQNNYRRQLKHENDQLKMKQPALQVDPKLMKEAANIVGKQASQGFLAHTSDEYRVEHQIQGENLFSGGGVDFPYEALKGFLASDKHRPSVVGSFTHVGYAIRAGVDDKTGNKAYFLVVVYGNGLPQEAPIIDIPDEERQPKILEAKNLEEAVKDRPYLKAHFDALQAEVEIDPELSLSFDEKLTKKMQQNSSLKGMFTVTLQKGEKSQNYSVYDRPPLFIRNEKKSDGTSETFQIAFHDVLQDFENINNAPEMTAEELDEAAGIHEEKEDEETE